MPTLTKESAKEHCRTCLTKLDGSSLAGNQEENTKSLNEEHDVKPLSINMMANENLRLLIEYYIEKETDRDRDDYPPNVCFGCFNKLQGFDKFRKQAVENVATLRALFCKDGIAKVEVDDVDEEKENSRGNIYSVMLKDAFMETETVVLMEHANIAALVNVELETPDPFSAENIANAPNIDSNLRRRLIPSDDDHAWPMNGLDSCSKDDDDDDDDEDEDKPLSRLIEKRQKADSISKRPKYRRRTKKEMELVRKEQAEKDKLRDKPRKKGTKNNYRCEQCNHSFAHKLTRDAHIRKVHEGSKRPYQCDRCDKRYSFFGGLWTHIREIHEAEERSYPCQSPGCDKIYTSLIAMQKHRREKHLGLVSNKTYVCELCGATFNQIANLKYHRRSKHPMETGESLSKDASDEKHICSICNKQFHSRYTLKYHLLQLHSNDMKFECNVCGRRMAKKFMLVQHMRIHTLDRLPCDQCEKQFIRKHELEAHVRAVHLKLKPYGCQYCPETFACRKTLRHHEYIHTGEKPYVCDICGQAYRQQTSLKTHRKTHSVAQPEALLAKNINGTLETFLEGQQQQGQ